jgi:glyoxylase-like metal-dependent hydrolase (beta-lactamase superfamily II)
MSVSPSFQSFTTSRGARVFAIPVEAFPNFWAYAYLVQTDDMLTLIDTGSGSDRSHASLQAGFEQASVALGKPVSFADLTHILITHGHIDHFGGLARLRELTGARVGIHELDVQTVVHHEARLSMLGRKLNEFLEQSGVSLEERGDLMRMYRFTKTVYHSVPVDYTFEAVDMQVGPFEMLHVPGHCPGHVAIKLEDVIFCGDHVIENIIPHQSPEELTPFMGLRHYLESLSVFQRWAEDVRLVLSGHDAPIPNLNARIAEIRANLSHRLGQTLNGFSEPRTIAEVNTLVYGEIGGYNSLLVLEKMGAYVEYLYQRGVLEISNLSELEGDGQLPSPLGRGAGGEGRPVIRYRCPTPVPEQELLPKERAYVFV